MINDLISRADLLKRMFPYDVVDKREYAINAKAVEKAILEAPSPVIHCRNCKHWSDGVAGCTDHIKCCKIGFYMVGENGYCVYGEAKDG